jgi:hypothetical protein
MDSMQAVLEQKLLARPVIVDRSDDEIKKIGILGSLFGCWHRRLTRPISDKLSTYQTCVECGARRQFDTDSFKAIGPFYYPANVDAGNAISV